MSFKALFYAYVLGGLTFIPLVAFGLVVFTIYTSVPVGDPDPQKAKRAELEHRHEGETEEEKDGLVATTSGERDLNDAPRPRKSWLTMRRTFQETEGDATYVGLVRGFLDARSKDPKKARPKDMWLAVLKGTVLFLYEDEEMTECEAVLDLAAHDVVIYPEGQPDAELYTKRNAVMLRPRIPPADGQLPSLTKEMKLSDDSKIDEKVQEKGGSAKKREHERERLVDASKQRDASRREATRLGTPWFIFFRNNVEMEDWYFALIHASDHPANHPMLQPFEPVFSPEDMAHLVETLDEQPDVIPTRWLNALIGRLFFSFYRTKNLESYIIGRLMAKLEKVKRPSFLPEILVSEVSVGNKPPVFSRPMLKELTKEGDASIEVNFHYKGEFRITVEATAVINLGARFKSYPVKLVLAAILRELEGNLLVKVKRMPSNRIWYAFTQPPKMDLVVEPIVSDRQITWGLITSTIESKMKEIILESIVLPNMDDIAFFNSKTKEHRGGIWADSRRQPGETTGEKTNTSEDEDAEVLTLPATMPAPDISEPADESASGVAPLTSLMANDLRTHSTPPESGGLPATIKSSTVNSSKTSLAQKRRSWFSGSQEAPYTESPPLEDLPRGRHSEPDVAHAPRSKSTPGHVRPDDSPIYNEHTPTHLSPAYSPQPSSPSSPSLSDHEGDTSSATPMQDEEYEPSSAGGLSTSAPSTPSLTRTASSSSRASAGAQSSAAKQASSFLDTLKARAAATDKEVLTKQAKETIRKWGVNMNWPRLRDAVGDKDKEKEKEREREREREDERDEAPDAGDHDSRETTPSRTTFADMRAKVEERRASRNDFPSPTLRGTSPVPIPGNRDRGRSVSAVSGNGGGSSGGDIQFPPTSISPIPGLRATSPALSASPMARTTTQPPRPKTMSIPGIHASHKGEVMSMGYTPPAPAPAPPTPASGATGSSVYSRLWKASVGGAGNQAGSVNGMMLPGSGSGATPTSTSSMSSTASTTPPANPTEERRIEDGTPTAPSSTAPPASIPDASTKPALTPGVPPALPPRNPSNALPVGRPVEPGSAASAALDRIRHRDEEVRASPQAPPLPPRKMKSTVGES